MIVKSDLEKKANFTFYQIFGLGASFLVLTLLLSVKLYSKLFLFWELFLGKLKSVCGCVNHSSFADHPVLFTFLLLLGLAGAVFFSSVIIKIIKFKRLTDKFIKNNLKNKKPRISRRLEKIAGPIKLENRIVEIQSPKPIIFCFGLICPKICVSSGIIKKLSNQELKAVLLHEQHHLFSHEPVKIFIVKSMIKALFFLPGLESFSRQYLVFSELAADQWATDNFENKASLAGALGKVIRWKKRLIARNGLALSFFANQVMEERVNKLVDSGYNPGFRKFSSKLSAGIVLALFFLIILSGVFSLDNPSIFEPEAAYCLSLEPEDISRPPCGASLKNPVCGINYSLKAHSCGN